MWLTPNTPPPPNRLTLRSRSAVLSFTVSTLWNGRAMRGEFLAVRSVLAFPDELGHERGLEKTESEWLREVRKQLAGALRDVQDERVRPLKGITGSVSWCVSMHIGEVVQPKRFDAA